MLEEYQRMVYGSIPADPYKKLLYKIIGRCELEKADIPNVIATTEDFMWFELSLIREYVDEERHNYERYRLSNLQKKISGAGSKHFDPNDSNPWYYFKVLLLSMQFEKV
jgi:nuclear pore complex protein Nup93